MIVEPSAARFIEEIECTGRFLVRQENKLLPHVTLGSRSEGSVDLTPKKAGVTKGGFCCEMLPPPVFARRRD